MSRLHPMVRDSSRSATAVRHWRTAIASAWGGTHRLVTVDAVLPLLESALAGHASLSEALTALGHRAGYDGHPLLEVADWVHLLEHVAPRRVRPALRSRHNAFLVSEAWTAGRMARRPMAGAERIDQLELRLGELYERCDSLGVSLERELALAVVAINGLPGCDEARGAVLAQAAVAAKRIFRSGESVAVLASGRVLVLAERQRSLAVRTRHLATAIAAGTDLDGVRVRHWIEPLPHDRTHLAEHLKGLAA